MPEHKIDLFRVSYYSAANVRNKPANDILEDRWLHKLFLVTHLPAAWSASKVAFALLILAALVWYSWLPLGPISFSAATIYLGFTLADWVLLSWLPQSGRSFGPIGPQLFVMTVPRLGVAIILGITASVLGRELALPFLWAVVILQAIGTLIYVWSTLYEPFALGVTQRAIQSSKLPAEALPIRLLHLSDLHIERLTQREARLLELIAEIAPDLIVITGDFLNLSYVDEPVARAEVRNLLSVLRAPYGVYATLGSPPVDPRDTTPSLFDGLNIKLLRDEVAVLKFKDGRTMSLLGLDCDHAPEADGRVFDALYRLTPGNSMHILLYHSPELMPLVQQYPVDLYLCGHTHGGQVRFPLYGALITSSSLGKRYEMGPYIEQDTTLYISRGIGLEGLSAPRIRLLCPPEIILFTLSGKS
ncbi:MAG TPA: metallophosphoesterase [Anaerolineae bacterium]|jgi:hypothetical protein